jgi:type IV pilus assembly protein PilM
MSLETESFALVRSLIGNDPTPAMLVNFGAMTTTISVIEHAIPLLNRSIDIGGRNITKKIAYSLKISEDKASHFKQDVGIADLTLPNSKAPQIIVDALEPVTSEIIYAKNIWQSQFGKSINKIVLTGGSANLPGLSDYLTKEIGIKTFLGDPWARVSYPEDLKPVLNEVGTKLSVALGLAMRNIE